MQQEDLNSIMKHPWEVVSRDVAHWNKCPSCLENYCGDGIEDCLECAKNKEMMK